MYIVDNESYTHFTFDTSVPVETIVDEVVVTGTHSAGKTTLVKDYATHTELLEDVSGYKLPQGFTASYEDIAGLIVPVVVAPEAATYYAERIARNNRVLTDQYTLEHQIGMESVAKSLITRANVAAAHLAYHLQPRIMYRPVAIVATDRSALDGHVYSQIRTPDAEHELVDMAHVARATGGKIPHNYAGHPIPFRENARRAAADNISIAFIAEHEEVPFATTERRVDDIQLREQIAQAMRAYYTTILGNDRVVTLSGNRIERREKFSSYLRELAHRMITAI